MKTKQISVLEYSQKISPAYFRKNRKYPDMPITRHSIMYRIRNNMELPEVIKYHTSPLISVFSSNSYFAILIVF